MARGGTRQAACRGWWQLVRSSTTTARPETSRGDWSDWLDVPANFSVDASP